MILFVEGDGIPRMYYYDGGMRLIYWTGLGNPELGVTIESCMPSLEEARRGILEETILYDTGDN